MAKCRVCKHSKEKKIFKIINQMLAEDPENSGLVCTLCGGCPIRQKTIVRKEKCKIKKW